MVLGELDRYMQKKETRPPIYSIRQNKNKIFKNEESLRSLWDIMKHNNICIIGIPEGEESEQGIEILFEEVITKNFPNLVKEKVTQV